MIVNNVRRSKEECTCVQDARQRRGAHQPPMPEQGWYNQGTMYTAHTCVPHIWTRIPGCVILQLTASHLRHTQTLGVHVQNAMTCHVPGATITTSELVSLSLFWKSRYQVIKPCISALHTKCSWVLHIHNTDFCVPTLLCLTDLTDSVWVWHTQALPEMVATSLSVAGERVGHAICHVVGLCYALQYHMRQMEAHEAWSALLNGAHNPAQSARLGCSTLHSTHVCCCYPHQG